MEKVVNFNPHVMLRLTKDVVECCTNPRKHEKKQIQKLANCITKFGIFAPIVIDEKGVVLAGHGRLQAARLLGLKEVPIICVEHLTETEKKAYMIADNRLTDESYFDNTLLGINLEELIKENFDLDLTGLDTPEIDNIMFDFEIDDKPKPDKLDKLPEESDVEQLTRPGYLYRIAGKHYLYCGNSLDSKTYEILMQGQKANMIFSDPPYNLSINDTVCERGKHREFAMASGEMADCEFTDFLHKAMQNMTNNSADGSIHYLCMDWRHVKHMLDASAGIYSEFKNLCVWNKKSGGLGSLYRSQHELVFVFKNGTTPHTNNVELGKNGRYRTNVWDYPGVRASNPKGMEELKIHPTVKPTSMVIDAILDCSKPNDIILDPFGGSGTTLLAAERTKRRAFLVEIDPHYCDVILARYMQTFKKKDIELISGNKEVNNG